MKISADPQLDAIEVRALHRRQPIEFFRAAMIGLVAGCLAVAFAIALRECEVFRDGLFHFLKFSDSPLAILLFPLFCALCGGLSGWITARYAPEAAGSGIPHIKGVLINARALRWQKVIPVKFIGGLLTILGGFSLGREGPTIQLGAAVGKLCADFFKIKRRDQLHLIACGAGAGLAAAFNAPLAGFIFVIEELRRELSPITYGTALIAAVVADAVSRLALGESPSFALPHFATPTLNILPLVLLFGALLGVVGHYFNKSLVGMLVWTNRHAIIPRWQRAAIVGLIVGLIGCGIPQLLGPGNEMATHLLKTSAQSVWWLLVLFFGKFLLTILCYVSKVPGGIFAPLLTLGVLSGMMFALLLGQFELLSTSDAGAFGVIGMAGLFAAVVQAPLTAVLLIVELTGNYGLLFPLLTASLGAYVVSLQLRTEPVYDALLRVNLKHRSRFSRGIDEPFLVQLVVEPGSKLDRITLKEVTLPAGCLVVTIRKTGTEIVPDGSTFISAGDEISLVIGSQQAFSLQQLKKLVTGTIR